MLISVVVPAHNEQLFLPRCLRALSEQSCERSRYEIIVVNSASTDRTVAIARRFADRVVDAPIGVAAARQCGFETAEGDIVASTDADSIVSPDWLAEISRSFLDHPTQAAVHGPVTFLDDEANRIDNTLANAWTYFTKFSANLGKPVFAGMNFAVNRATFFSVGGFDVTARSAEDILLADKLAQIGTIGFNPRMRVSTSMRRIKAEGYGKWFWFHLRNYASVIWFGRRPLFYPPVRA